MKKIVNFFRKKQIILVGIALAISIASVVLLSTMQIDKVPDFATVVVTDTDIKVGTILTEGHLKHQTVLQENVPVGSYSSESELIGKEVITNLRSDIIITDRDFVKQFANANNENKLSIEIANPSDFLTTRLEENAPYILVAYTSSGEYYNEYLVTFLHKTDDAGNLSDSNSVQQLPTTIIVSTPNEVMARELAVVSSVHNISVVQPNNFTLENYAYEEKMKEFEFPVSDNDQLMSSNGSSNVEAEINFDSAETLEDEQTTVEEIEVQ